MKIKNFSLMYNPSGNGTLIESLNNLEDYIDYVIHSAIINDGHSADSECYLVPIIYNRLLNGEDDIFTSDEDIKNRIADVDKKDFYIILIKNAIEYIAYKEFIKHQIANNTREDIVCSLITDKMAQNEYIQTLELIKTREEYKQVLINVYANYRYGKTDKDDIYKFVSNRNDSSSKRALDCLELNLGYCKKKRTKNEL